MFYWYYFWVAKTKPRTTNSNIILKVNEVKIICGLSLSKCFYLFRHFWKTTNCRLCIMLYSVFFSGYADDCASDYNNDTTHIHSNNHPVSITISHRTGIRGVGATFLFGDHSGSNNSNVVISRSTCAVTAICSFNCNSHYATSQQVGGDGIGNNCDCSSLSNFYSLQDRRWIQILLYAGNL